MFLVLFPPVVLSTLRKYTFTKMFAHKVVFPISICTFCLNAHHTRIRGRKRRGNVVESQAPKRKWANHSQSSNDRKWGRPVTRETLHPKLQDLGMGLKQIKASQGFPQIVFLSIKVKNPHPLFLSHRKAKTEYRSNFRSPLQYCYKDGAWVKARTAQVEVSRK